MGVAMVVAVVNVRREETMSIHAREKRGAGNGDICRKLWDCVSFLPHERRMSKTAGDGRSVAEGSCLFGAVLLVFCLVAASL